MGYYKNALSIIEYDIRTICPSQVSWKISTFLGGFAPILAKASYYNKLDPKTKEYLQNFFKLASTLEFPNLVRVITEYLTTLRDPPQGAVELIWNEVKLRYRIKE